MSDALLIEDMILDLWTALSARSQMTMLERAARREPGALQELFSGPWPEGDKSVLAWLAGQDEETRLEAWRETLGLTADETLDALESLLGSA